MVKKILFLISVLFIASCEYVSDNSANNNFARTLPEDQVIEKVMNEFIAEPNSQHELDRNIIINYVIDHKLDMKSTESGIYYQILKKGKGTPPSPKDEIIANYHGTFLDGTVFDSTKDKKPFEFPISRLNQGWQEILPMMNNGSKGIFIIPSKLCYGKRGFGDLIPPNTILKFEIELLGIKKFEDLPQEEDEF